MSNFLPEACINSHDVQGALQTIADLMSVGVCS